MPGLFGARASHRDFLHHRTMPDGSRWNRPPARDEQSFSFNDCEVRCKTGGVQLFSQWSTSDINGDNTSMRATPEHVEAKNLAEGAAPIPIRWQIDVWAYERLRTSAGNLTPLKPEQITDLGNVSITGFTPQNRSQHFSRLKVRIGWHTPAGGTFRDVDIGAGIQTGAVRASRVWVRALAPTVHFKDPVTKTNRAAPELSGTVLDTFMGVSIAPCESPQGAQAATFTQTVNIAATETSLLRRPPGAQKVTLYQSPEGSLATPRFLFTMDPPAASVFLHDIAMGADRRVVELPVPGQAQAVDTGIADPLFERFMTAVWGLDL